MEIQSYDGMLKSLGYNTTGDQIIQGMQEDLR